ncbi:TPA: hypothetical protein DEP34_02065 [Candidatus Uhrbacteria bacterium]|uniref:HEPN AbiU2-like domain-containing protein n=2 Tax=Candidatus Uhriibacteriota TaxID=1752732 RepID=A0A0G1T6A4_9BACT|nr:MAG: hypothetical protein UX45_C0014G0009 [Candidatus Uhrbacteria bacterium GW2011_GWF2_46_218]KKU40915.1 MAG: hypothetical protein UX57_C0008G0027 [Candidatus Uhrbacteria bacterium GW2011_GWE2_46_68]HBK33979.1 hypothetical protein [Candidatus Uhrbacteria bacterium]HCB19149.1 hypothetical protein [Candidatus Uhrbacteria bacterium]
MDKQQSNSAEFKTLMEYAKEMHHRYFRAISAFYAFEALKEVRAPNIVGQSDAEENAKTMARYNGLFTPAEEALRVYFFLELAKMFDSSKQALHINKILNFTASNLKKLTVDAFKEYNQSQPRAFLETLVNEYKGMDHEELVVIKEMLNKHETVLEKLETYRDKWLAHDDKKKPKLPSITGEEIKALFEVLAKMLNTITGRLNSESWTYSHVEGDVKHHIRLVVDHLRRFEPYRLKEIEEKYQIKSKES